MPLDVMKSEIDLALVDRLIRRAFVLTTQMIFEANHRKDKELGDPKVGGHPASCASSNHILGALHLLVRNANDWICCKPHAAPLDHSFHFLLGLLRRPDGSWMNENEAEVAMHHLRHFSWEGEPTFQSYHASSDPDHQNFLPSGSVGIPPVNSAYLALAYKFAEHKGHEVPKDAHFWSLIGDSEFREGSLMECMPDAAERQLGNVTWIIDYNRQNLDGARVTNTQVLGGTDADRIRRSSEANGWHVIECRHGRFREEVFSHLGGEHLREVLEHGLSDYVFNMLLLKEDAAEVRRQFIAREPRCSAALETLSDDEVIRFLYDVGGHDLSVLVDALLESKRDKSVPCLIIAHTIKGFGLECSAATGNHSALPEAEEMTKLLEAEGLAADRPYAGFASGTKEAAFLAKRGSQLRAGLDEQLQLRERNRARVLAEIEERGGLPTTLGIDQLKNVPVAHTQWTWGQWASKIIRVGTTNELLRKLGGEGRELKPDERRWEPAAVYTLTLSPDVGTSTNINPSMDNKVFAPATEADLEKKWEIHDKRRPDLVPSEQSFTSHLRFEIAEANCMSAAGSIGKMGDFCGLPFLPMMTVYDFFIKRALDQLYYNLYWGSEMILVGTPSGVTLSPEGAQHSWKSDLQIPNMVTWEPAFAIEIDWILSDAVARHALRQNAGRKATLLRAVTRGIEQRQMIGRLQRHWRFKAGLAETDVLAASPEDPGKSQASVPAIDDESILEATRLDCLQGAYYLIDWRGYAGYQPGDNVVHVFSLGALVTEAVAAADALVAKGIYANVIVVSSPDLLLGNFADHDGYRHLRENLEVDGRLHLWPHPTDRRTSDLLSLAGGRIPIVAVCDGEAGLLDNIGSIVGVRQETLAVRKFSKCGKPSDIYRYQHLDGDAIMEACFKVLADTALERVIVHPEALRELRVAESRGPVSADEIR